MIIINKDLYIKEELKKNIGEVKENLKQGIIPKNMYFICLAENSNDAFDIYSSYEMGKKLVREKDKIVFGISYTKADAIIIVENMVSEYFATKKDLNGEMSLRQYFENR